jgi:hypothetical protein
MMLIEPKSRSDLINKPTTKITSPPDKIESSIESSATEKPKP